MTTAEERERREERRPAFGGGTYPGTGGARHPKSAAEVLNVPLPRLLVKKSGFRRAVEKIARRVARVGAGFVVAVGGLRRPQWTIWRTSGGWTRRIMGGARGRCSRAAAARACRS